MRFHRTVLVGAMALMAACSSGDRSAAIKAAAAIRPGMALADVVDTVESHQLPDIRVSLSSDSDCPPPAFSIDRYSGPPSIRVYSEPGALKLLPSQRSYREDGFASREAFIAAVRQRAPDFLGCRKLDVFMNRYQGFGFADHFTVEFDTTGHVTRVSPLEEVGD